MKEMGHSLDDAGCVDPNLGSAKRELKGNSTYS